jgi:hypothetical protein
MDKYIVLKIFMISILIVGCSPVDGNDHFEFTGTAIISDTLCGGKVQGIGFVFNLNYRPAVLTYVDSTKNIPDIRLNARINSANKFIGIAIITPHAGQVSILPGLGNTFNYVGLGSPQYKLNPFEANYSFYELAIADTIKKYQVWAIRYDNSSPPNSALIFIDNIYYSAPAIVTNTDTIICTVVFDYKVWL